VGLPWPECPRRLLPAPRVARVSCQVLRRLDLGRLNAQTGMIENGFVYIPEAAPWLAEYLYEMTVFPKGTHDDQVDPTARFLDWFNRPVPEPRIL
jgi:predicted phage terminase large subunit-like protein